MPVSIYVVLLRHEQGAGSFQSAQSSCCKRFLLPTFRIAVCDFYNCQFYLTEQLSVASDSTNNKTSCNSRQRSWPSFDTVFYCQEHHSTEEKLFFLTFKDRGLTKDFKFQSFFFFIHTSSSTPDSLAFSFYVRPLKRRKFSLI